MINNLIKLANHLDKIGFGPEASYIDGLIRDSNITRLAKKIDDREISDMPPEEAFAVGIAAAEMGLTSDDEKGKEELGDSDKEQVEFADHVTENFDLCPGAVKAFTMLSEISGEHEDAVSSASGDTYEELTLGAMGATDDLLGIERVVLEEKQSSAEQLTEALELSRTASYFTGMLSEVIGQELGANFEFLDMHVKVIAELMGSIENDIDDVANS
jgi:hypothetical protein